MSRLAFLLAQERGSCSVAKAVVAVDRGVPMTPPGLDSSSLSCSLSGKTTKMGGAPVPRPSTLDCVSEIGKGKMQSIKDG